MYVVGSSVTNGKLSFQKSKYLECIFDCTETALGIVIANLRADTQYQVQVLALTRKGDGLRSRSRKIKTPVTQGPPLIPLHPPRSLVLTLSSTDFSAVIVTWERPIQAKLPVLEYKLEWVTGSSIAEQRMLTSNENACTVPSLG